MVNRTVLALAVVVGGAILVVSASPARAQTFADRAYIASERIESPEYLAWELFRVGPYDAAGRDELMGLNGGDNGPLVTTEVHGYLFRIPYVGPLAVGARFGWAKYTGRALAASDMQPTGEKNKLVMFPFTPLGALRIDVLAREVEIPIVLTGKIGLDVIRWKLDRGGSREADGTSLGLNWGAQIALELDFLEPRAARRLDEEWGINHSYIFFELFGSTAGAAAGGTLDLSDPLAWAAGLGFNI